MKDNNLTLEKAAKEAVESEDNVLVQAGPGAGKTELLAQKAMYIFENNLLKNNKKILAISFKKDSADNLKKRVVLRCGKENGEKFISLTFDAFCKMLIDQFRNGVPVEYRPSKDYVVMTKDASNEIAEIYEDFYNQQYNLTFTKKNNLLLKVESIRISSMTPSDEVYPIWNKLINQYPSKLTFKMINSLVIFLLEKNQNILKAVQHTFEYIFLDEFQDTTTQQYELIKMLFKGADSKLIAVGDSNQRIMVWAGADKEIFDKFKNDFSAKEKTLLMNYRSCEKLVNFQKKIYTILNEKGNSNEISSGIKDGTGSIELLEFLKDDKEAEVLSNFIKDKISKGTKCSDICILVKQTPEKVVKKIQEQLLKYNIVARIETEYQDLIRENIVKLILSCINLMYGHNNIESWNFILQFLGEEIDDKNLRVFDRNLMELKKKNLKYNELTFNDFVNGLIETLGKEKIKSVFNEYKNDVYFEETICKFKKLFISTSENESFIERIKDFLGENSIPIMTIHKSKGLEYDTVIFVGLEDQFFWSFKDQPDEDKCSFFVALSRAKHNIIFTFTHLRYEKQILRKHKVINEIYSLLIEDNDVNKLKYYSDSDFLEAKKWFTCPNCGYELIEDRYNKNQLKCSRFGCYFKKEVKIIYE